MSLAPSSLVSLDAVTLFPDFARVVLTRVAFATRAHTPDLQPFRPGALGPRESFAAGRRCAAEALRLLGCSEWAVEIPRGAGGEPLWPHGFVGSIAHLEGVTSAAAAPLKDVQALGLDLELPYDTVRMLQLSRSVQHACETRLKARGLDAAMVFTLGLSAKRSLFKCLYPLVHRRFDYRDAAVRRIDTAAQQIEMELLTSLGPGFHRGRRFTGLYRLDRGSVATGFFLDAHRELRR